jgi:hypothetical protein
MEPRNMPERFLVALTFSGNERGIILRLAEALEARLGRGTVYYDEWYRHYFAGNNADLRMQSVYEDQAELVVVGVSGSYGSKQWTKVEYEAVRSLQMRLGQSGDERDQLRILPLRVGDGDVKGIRANTVALDIRTQLPEATAELVIDRLRLACPEALPSGESSLSSSPRPHLLRANGQATGSSLLAAQEELAHRLTGGRARMDLPQLDLTMVLVPRADNSELAFWCASAPVTNRHRGLWADRFGAAFRAEPGPAGALRWSTDAVNAIRPLLEAEELNTPDMAQAASLSRLWLQDRSTLHGLGIQSALRNFWSHAADGALVAPDDGSGRGTLVLVSDI